MCICDANDPATVLRGLILKNSVTNANFYSMVEIIFIFNSNHFLRDEGGTKVQRDDHPLQPGNYYCHTGSDGQRDCTNQPKLTSDSERTYCSQQRLNDTSMKETYHL